MFKENIDEIQFRKYFEFWYLPNQDVKLSFAFISHYNVEFPKSPMNSARPRGKYFNFAFIKVYFEARIFNRKKLSSPSFFQCPTVCVMIVGFIYMQLVLL